MLEATKPNAEVDPRQAVINFLSGYSIETTPAGSTKIADFRDYMPAGATIYITHLPGTELSDSVAVARRLRNEGFNPVPHIAARSIPDAGYLDENVWRLVDEAEVEDVLIIGGGLDNPVGTFSDSMQIMESGILDKYGIKRIGVAGHPEGSPDISDAEIARAVKWKNEFHQRSDANLEIVTQFCFKAEPVIAWDRALRAAGNELPIRIGIPGIATLRTLLNYAKMCGVGNSVNFLKRQSKNVVRLLKPTAPDQLILDLATYKASDPNCGLIGCHVYPLGGTKRTTAWTNAIIDGRIIMKPAGRGFDVDVALDW